MDRKRARAYLYLALAMATVGSIVPASRVIARSLPPEVAGAGRLLVAALVLVPWALRRERAALRPLPSLHDGSILLLQAAAGTVGFTVLLVLGTARTTATDASVVAGTLPAVAAGLSCLFLGERPDRRRWLAIALAVGGLLALQAPWAEPGATPWAAGRLAGDLLVLGAVACESLFILLQKRARRPLPALAQAAVMTALGLLALSPAALWSLRLLDLRAVPPEAWLAVAYYGLVPTVLGFVWWYRGAAEVSGAEAGVFTAVMPLSGATLSALVLGEPLGPRHLVALGLVVGAVALAAGKGAPRLLSHAHRTQRRSAGPPDRGTPAP